MGSSEREAEVLERLAVQAGSFPYLPSTSSKCAFQSASSCAQVVAADSGEEVAGLGEGEATPPRRTGEAHGDAR